MLARVYVNLSHLAMMALETEIAGPISLVTKSFSLLCSLSLSLTK